jgi:hypothetical protein
VSGPQWFDVIHTSEVPVDISPIQSLLKYAVSIESAWSASLVIEDRNESLPNRLNAALQRSQQFLKHRAQMEERIIVGSFAALEMN